MKSIKEDCIFYLDNDPYLAAQALFDDDLKSTILYLSIVVSKTLRELLPDVDWQKEGYSIYQTDQNKSYDTDVRWLQSTPSIWNWSKSYFEAMLVEYEFRFDTKHPSHDLRELFDLEECSLDKDFKDEFVSPSIAAVPSKFHADSNFRTQEVFKDKKGKGKWKASVLCTFRNLYRIQYNNVNGGCDYTKRERPQFMLPTASQTTTESSTSVFPSAPPRRWGATAGGLG